MSNTKVRILFIDDDYLGRFQPFSHYLEKTHSDEYDVAWVNTPQKAISMIEQHSFDIICFDHDLGFDENDNDIKATEVSRWLGYNNEKFPYLKEVSFFIHSFNPEGAKLIQSHLNSFSKKVNVVRFDDLIRKERLWLKK